MDMLNMSRYSHIARTSYAGTRTECDPATPDGLRLAPSAGAATCPGYLKKIAATF